MALCRAFVPAFTFALFLISSAASAFSIEDYDANIEKALKGEFVILNSIEKEVDLGTEDANLNNLLKAIYRRFGKGGFAAFLSKQGGTADVSGFRITSEGVKGEGGYGKVFAMSAESRSSFSAIKNVKKVRFEIAVKMLLKVPQNGLDKYDLEVELNNMKFLPTTKSTDGFSIAVPYYGAFVDSGKQTFILTQLLNESLADYTTKPDKVLSNADIDRLITSLGGGLATWRTLGFVDGDIKPDNIMRDSSGHFYFIDFGTTRRLTLSQMRDGNTYVDKYKGRKGTLMANIGTPAMKAPEKVLDDRSKLGPINWGDSDVYSFGLTLWAVLAHRPEGALLRQCDTEGRCSPRFHKGDMKQEDFEAFRAFAQGLIPIGPQDTRSIKAAKRLVMRMLAWHPSDRPSNILTIYRNELRL